MCEAVLVLPSLIPCRTEKLNGRALFEFLTPKIVSYHNKVVVLILQVLG